MLKKTITYYGKEAIAFCDGKCDKAWGINRRPFIQLDENNEDDIAFLADNELDIAPVNPGTYEGGEGKPLSKEDALNRWCVRECERCSVLKTHSEANVSLVPKDFSVRIYNIPKGQ